jgi:predicted membrane chloride channel (bestrophin family)
MQNELREFNKMDKDGGGSIDLEGFVNMQQRSGSTLTREELKTLFDQFDADGSGSIDLQEYIKAKGAIDSGRKTVPLTGDTLQAGLKMRCDMSGASYAIYWANQKGKLKVVDSYKSATYKAELAGRGVLESFAEASKPFALDAKGQGPIAKVLRNGEPLLIDNVGESNLARRELALQYGINAIAFGAYEDGVIEYGTTTASATQWARMPEVPTLPKDVMRKAFEELGALYLIYWRQDGSVFRVAADYEVPSSVNSRLRRRSDGVSFISNSKQLALDANGNGPVSLATKTGEEQVVCFGLKDGTDLSSKLKRAQAAQAFGIKTIHFVPFEAGVLEYGVSGEAALSDVTLAATLRMQCEATNAAYALYWKDVGGQALVAGRYVTATHSQELKRMGKKLSFAEVSQALIIDADSSSCVGKVLSNRQPIFVQNAKIGDWTVNKERVQAANDYGIQSICFLPVLGGVLEVGNSDACVASGTKWDGVDDVTADGLPKAELERAFRSGATYAIYWKPDYKKGTYVLGASFETSAQALSEEACETKTYVNECRDFRPSIESEGPIGLAGSSGVSIKVLDTAKDKNFKRSALAQTYGIGQITFVPCNGGVLEWGQVTKDLRGTTVGPEFQEAQRRYRRTVFNAPDWATHRSTARFEKSIKTLFDSGIIRSRYKELLFVGGVAALTIAVNCVTAGYVDFDNVKQPPIIPHLPTFSIPIALFTLTSPTLGLLLVFRTNACYARWDDSRKIWGDIINKCRTLVRQANTFMGDEYPGYGDFQDWRRRIAAETSAFTRCLRCFLRGPEDAQNLRAELKNLGFAAEEVEGYMSAGNRQCYALQCLGNSLRKADMDMRARTIMDETITKLCDDVGACERIFKTPIPVIYTRHTSRYVGLWLALLPLAIWSVDPSWNHLITIPSTMVITFFLLGIEELGLQIEEPFSILPIEAFCDASIGVVLNDMVLAADKDRGVDKLFFSRYDTSGDGNIDMSEFAALCADMGRTFTDDELAETMQVLDANGDGELSYDEFKWWWDNDMSDIAIKEKALNSADTMKGGGNAPAPKQLATAAASANAGIDEVRAKADAGSALKTLPRNPDVAWKSSGYVEVQDQFPKSDPNFPLPAWKEAFMEPAADEKKDASADAGEKKKTDWRKPSTWGS